MIKLKRYEGTLEEWAKTPYLQDVLIVIINLDTLNLVAEDYDLLSVEENKRFRSFVEKHDADKFAKRKVILKKVLAACLKISPPKVVLEFESYGKPVIKDSIIHFSTSSRSGWAAIFLSHSRIGGDIEFISTDFEDPSFTKHFLTIREQQILLSVISTQKGYASLLAWTAKEAQLKLEGTGFLQEPNKLELLNSWCQEQSTWLCKTPVALLNADDFPKGFAVAVATEKTPSNIKLYVGSSI